MSYFYCIHELFHFLTASNKRKTKKNFGYTTNSFPTGPTQKEEIIDEIKTIYMNSIWFNDLIFTDKEGKLTAAIGIKHQFYTNNTTYLCSLMPFGKYKRMVNPLGYPPIKDFNETNPSDIAKMIKFIDEIEVQKTNATSMNRYSYRDPTWKDYLINAECSIEAFNDLKNKNFIDNDFTLKPIKEWDLQFDFHKSKK